MASWHFMNEATNTTKYYQRRGRSQGEDEELADRGKIRMMEIPPSPFVFFSVVCISC